MSVLGSMSVPVSCTRQRHDQEREKGCWSRRTGGVEPHLNEAAAASRTVSSAVWGRSSSVYPSLASSSKALDFASGAVCAAAAAGGCCDATRRGCAAAATLRAVLAPCKRAPSKPAAPPNGASIGMADPIELPGPISNNGADDCVTSPAPKSRATGPSRALCDNQRLWESPAASA